MLKLTNVKLHQHKCHMPVPLLDLHGKLAELYLQNKNIYFIVSRNIHYNAKLSLTLNQSTDSTGGSIVSECILNLDLRLIYLTFDFLYMYLRQIVQILIGRRV